MLYDSKENFTQPEYTLFHNNDSSSTLYYTFQWSDFLYIKGKGHSEYTATAQLSYSLWESYESKEVLDSGVVYLTDSLYFGHNKKQLDSVLFHAPPEGEMVMKVTLKDVNRDKDFIHFLPVHTESRYDQQYFLARDENGHPLFSHHLSKTSRFSITSSSPKTTKLRVRYYYRDFPIAIPPFSIDNGEPFDYKEDSLYTIPLIGRQTSLMALSDEGFYHFQADSADKEGFTLFRFSDDFPAVTTTEDILTPLRYITTGREYEKLERSPVIKLAIDSFWLENSGNINRAKTLISKYYNRVQDANRLFTSYLEGWKTDRGMLYIVFGPPNNVYRGTNTESWIYGEAGSSMAIRFNFVRVNNPFTFNDFSLYRNPYYKESWYTAVETWRR